MLSNKKVKKDNIEEEKKIAEKLNEAISKAEEEKADEDLADDELTPAEELSTDIAVRLADVTAQRFAEITGDANLCAIRQLVRRFETEGGRTVVSMLQAVFLSHGMKHAAEELDFGGDMKHVKESRSDEHACNDESCYLRKP